MLDGVGHVSIEERFLTAFPSEQDISLYSRVYELSVSESWPVESIYLEKGRLDDVFRQLTKGAQP